MRKVGIALSALLVVGGGMAYARRRGRPTRPAVAAAPAVIPASPQIATELGAIQWGWTKEQVIDYYRQQIAAKYQPRMRNLGLIEQDHLIAQRDAEVKAISDSFIQFNGLPNQRRWDSSIIGQEYTHGNGETMIVVNDTATQNREFFFFINGKLWKRYQARGIPGGAQLDFETFAASMEGLFGPGLKLPKENDPDHLQTEVWQDDNTVLHLADFSSFYSTFGIIFEERATLSRIAELRRNAPPPSKNQLPANTATNVTGNENTGAADDPNADVSARIAARIRTQMGDAGVTTLSGDGGGLFAPSPTPPR